jgi:hypothetical protein
VTLRKRRRPWQHFLGATTITVWRGSQRRLCIFVSTVVLCCIGAPVSASPGLFCALLCEIFLQVFTCLACNKLNMCRALLQAHEVEGCSFPANISDRANLTVAGQALTALDGSNLFGSHGTVFLPNDAAFTALVTALSEFHVLRRQSQVPHPVRACWRAALL